MRFMSALWTTDFLSLETISLATVVVSLIAVSIFSSEGGLSDEYSWNRTSDMAGYFGMSHSTEYDVEAGVGVKSGAVMQEQVIQTFMPSSGGFSYSEQRVQNRGRKGFRASQPDETRRQSFYHLQHRYTKLFSWPVIAVLIAVLVALLLFRGFYYSSTRGTGVSVSFSSRISNGQAETAVDSRLDSEPQARFSRHVKYNHSRAARAGIMFRRKVLDTLQGMLWVRTALRIVYYFHLMRQPGQKISLESFFRHLAT